MPAPSPSSQSKLLREALCDLDAFMKNFTMAGRIRPAPAGGVGSWAWKSANDSFLSSKKADVRSKHFISVNPRPDGVVVENPPTVFRG